MDPFGWWRSLTWRRRSNARVAALAHLAVVPPKAGGSFTVDLTPLCPPGHGCQRRPMFTGSDTRHGADQCQACGVIYIWCGEWHFRGRGELLKNGGDWDAHS